MLLPRFFSRSKTRSIRRPLAHRRPLVETLEGRQLLATFVSPALGPVGSHIGTSAMIQGGHIGTSAMIQGGHIGTGVADVLIKQ